MLSARGTHASYADQASLAWFEHASACAAVDACRNPIWRTWQGGGLVNIGERGAALGAPDALAYGGRWGSSGRFLRSRPAPPGPLHQRGFSTRRLRLIELKDDWQIDRLPVANPRFLEGSRETGYGLPMKRSYLAVVGVLGAGLAACGGSSSNRPDGGGGDAGTVCADYANKYCARVAACAPGYLTLVGFAGAADCGSYYQTTCALGLAALHTANTPALTQQCGDELGR